MSRKILLRALVLVAVAIGVVVATQSTSNQPKPGASSVAQVAPTATSGAWTNVLVADHATDGTLTIVIPEGAADEMDAGNTSAIQLPSVMHLKIGDRIVIENHDSRPHLVMYAYVLPGATNERVFASPDLQVYSAGCSVTASQSGTFMTLMVER